MFWRSTKSAIRSHLSASWCHTVLFSRLCVILAMASHSAANLRKRSAVIAAPGARTLLQGQTPIPLNGSDWNEENSWPKTSSSNRRGRFQHGGGPILNFFLKAPEPAGRAGVNYADRASPRLGKHHCTTLGGSGLTHSSPRTPKDRGRTGRASVGGPPCFISVAPFIAAIGRHAGRALGRVVACMPLGL